MSNNINIFLAQEMWLTRNFSKSINDYLFIYYSLSKTKSSREKKYIIIFLFLNTRVAYQAISKLLSKTSLSDPSKTITSRLIAIRLSISGRF